MQLSRVEDARKIANHQLVTALHLPEGTEISPDTYLLEQQTLPSQRMIGRTWPKPITFS